MNHIIHVAYTSPHTHGGETTNLRSNRARGRRWDNFTGNKNLGRVVVPINFIMSIGSKKHITRVVLALEMAQAFNTLKAQTKRVINVRCFHLALNMIVVFSIHALHLFGNSHWLTNKGEFKQHVIVKLHGEKIDCFNSKCCIM
jgi:hypothetical protein